MAKRNQHSRWRRLPQVFRFGEHKLPNMNMEPQRLTVYLPAYILDAAERQAAKAGIETIQDYCTGILHQAIEAELVREQASEVEAKQALLEGLQAIADDPEYLAEWSAQVESRTRPTAPSDSGHEPVIAEGSQPAPTDPSPPQEGIRKDPFVLIPGPPRDETLSDAARVILRHAGQGDEDPLAFLPSLRRGESTSVTEVADLARALQTLEGETLNSPMLDRRVVFALHRLAYEGQILHTDAWPGTFDPWTVDALRAVQEAVERILSGQDIRYFPKDHSSEDSR